MNTKINELRKCKNESISISLMWIFLKTTTLNSWGFSYSQKNHFQKHIDWILITKLKINIRFTLNNTLNTIFFLASHFFLFFIAVHPVINVRNQLVGSPFEKDVTIECNVEASPKSINYWIKDVKDGTYTQAGF